MTGNAAPHVPISGDDAASDVALQRHWRNKLRLSSLWDAIERFLRDAGLDRGPWLAIAFAAGIGLWFVLDTPTAWIAAIAATLTAAALVRSIWRDREDRSHLRVAVLALGLTIAAGISLVWARSAIVGAEPIARPAVATLDARVLDRIEQPALDRIRLVVATREPASKRAIKVRLNVPDKFVVPGMHPGALIRLQARLMPPAPPMLPGSYNFARTAWFKGYAATGSVLRQVTILDTAQSGTRIQRLQSALSTHVRAQLEGSPGTIAAAFASGDRGAIAEADEDAMRDAGLTHLLSISGLHVSAVMAGAYFLAIKLLALWPWLTLRVRLPLVAAGFAALAGIGYTLLTGAEVPTIRSCAGAVLVLVALALGREPLSLRMVAAAAIFILLLWPESLVGPSFQMSFAAVIAIVALHTSRPAKSFLRPREEGTLTWLGRRALMLLLTGLVIEIALMPIVLFHFHRAGVYGALANVIAIPLTTFISMPLIALALALDLLGIGEPAWWLAGHSLDLLLAIAHWTAERPGAVTLMPAMSGWILALFVIGGLWVGLWRGPARMAGLVPFGMGGIALAFMQPPDLLVSGDGRHVGITGEGDRLLVLRDGGDFGRENLLELSGMNGTPLPLAEWRGARCNQDFCSVSLHRAGRAWHILLTRSGERVGERALAAACDRADIVIADRWLPRSCNPRWLKADRRLLSRTGGLAIDLKHGRLRTVADTQGGHGWWQGTDS